MLREEVQETEAILRELNDKYNSATRVMDELEA